ncbi:MAG: AMP-dependent synthetase/ligase, partial [Bradymonadales bacterium]
MSVYRNLAGLLEHSASKFGSRKIFGEKRNGQYEWITYAEFSKKVRRLRRSLHELGLLKGERIAIIANNSVAWAMCAYAAYGLGAVIVPMYEVQSTEDWKYILNDSEAKFVFVSKTKIAEAIAKIGANSVERVFDFSCEDVESEQNFSSLHDPAVQEMEMLEVGEDELADILYTSGTTGLPKGVMLSHKNIIVNAKVVQSLFEVGETDVSLAFLPWAHAFGKTVELHTFVSFGAAIGIAESTRTIAKNLQEINPTIINSVPKIFNTIYDTIHQRMQAESWISRSVFEHARALTYKKSYGGLSFAEQLQYRAIVPAVSKKIRAAFGNRIRFCISGGAAIAKEVAEFFDGFGLPIYEGYGMTETGPIICVNCPAALRYGSVGRALPQVKLRIDAERQEQQGEIITSSPCVMLGYYKAPESDAEVFTEKRELRTGDMGYIDEDGFLWITGRVKEQYKLENGKYVVPTALEMKINASPVIEQSVVFGDGRPYNIVLIQPTQDFIESMRKKHGLKDADNDSVEKHPELRCAIENEIKRLTKDFRGYERPQAFFITLEPLTIENGLLSPALKVRRRE